MNATLVDTAPHTYQRWMLPVVFLLTVCLALPARAVLTVDSGNGTVEDSATSLVWDQCPYGLVGATCSSGSVFYGHWDTALTMANGSSYKGFTDWHLPNIKELESIVKIDAHNPAIDPVAFPATPSNLFWSSTTNMATPALVWAIDFSSGASGNYDKTNNGHFRLVRGGQPSASFDALAADSTPPTTTSGPTVSSATSISASISVTINEAGTGYWLLVPNAATAPTSAQVVAGANYGAVTVVGSGNTAMTAATPVTINLTGLTAGTTYKLYFVAKDASNNLQSAVGFATVTTVADSTPPTTTASPSVSNGLTATTASISVTINEAGTGYWVLVAGAATAPTSAQVVAGVNYGAVTLVRSGNTAMSAATPASISLSGLTTGTAYKLYFVAKDSANNLQASPTTVALTTKTASPNDLTPILMLLLD